MQAALYGGVKQDLGGAFAAAAGLPLKEARVSSAAHTGWSWRLPALSIFLCCVLVRVPPFCTDGWWCAELSITAPGNGCHHDPFLCQWGVRLLPVTTSCHAGRQGAQGMHMV